MEFLAGKVKSCRFQW